MNSRRQALGQSIRVAAMAMGVAASAPAFEQPPVETAPSPAAEPIGGKEGVADAPSEPEQPAPLPESWRRERSALVRGRSTIELFGYMQADVRHFEWGVAGHDTGPLLAKEAEIRRIRIGSKARFGNLLLELTIDPRSPQGSSRINTVASTYSFSKRLNLRAGLFKLPGSREFNVLSYGTDFVERSMIATRLVPARDWGVTAGGALGRVEYQLGAFRGDGNASLRRSGASGVFRLSANLRSGFQLSGSFLQGQVSGDPIGGGAAPLPKKLQATALWETYSDPLVAPNPGNRGPYFSVMARVQFMIP